MKKPEGFSTEFSKVLKELGCFMTDTDWKRMGAVCGESDGNVSWEKGGEPEIPKWVETATDTSFTAHFYSYDMVEQEVTASPLSESVIDSAGDFVPGEVDVSFPGRYTPAEITRIVVDPENTIEEVFEGNNQVVPDNKK